MTTNLIGFAKSLRPIGLKKNKKIWRNGQKVNRKESSETPTKRFTFGDSHEGESNVIVWCDGRDYDPITEMYRPIYSYSIVTPKWRYDANDIFGAYHEMPNLDLASRSLWAFLLSCVEAQDENSENYGLFPEQVREWAQHFSDEIKVEYIQLKR